jgi:hypothetical protein
MVTRCWAGLAREVLLEEAIFGFSALIKRRKDGLNR